MVVLISGFNPLAVSHESEAASHACTSVGGAATSIMPLFGSSLPLGHLPPEEILEDGGPPRTHIRRPSAMPTAVTRPPQARGTQPRSIMSH
jgi:hypothetical protein